MIPDLVENLVTVLYHKSWTRSGLAERLNTGSHFWKMWFCDQAWNSIKLDLPPFTTTSVFVSKPASAQSTKQGLGIVQRLLTSKAFSCFLLVLVLFLDRNNLTALNQSFIDAKACFLAFFSLLVLFHTVFYIPNSLYLLFAGWIHACK